jgi:hypothetical protein
MNHGLRSALASIAMLLLLPLAAWGDQSVSHGNYVIHYNAIPSTFLTAETAREYGITRSGSRAMLNISVQKKTGNGPGTVAVPAKVRATATNLSGQIKGITMREIRDGDAIYYIGEVGVANQEILDFNVDVTLPEQTEPYVVRFRKQFFND